MTQEVVEVVEVLKRESNGYHNGAHIKFTVAVNSQQGLGIWKVIILHK